ncbi:hypothetical protein AKJ09_01942 [Labilithrix luteola]|uniref:Uncharacterized protein n=1 Tax=Labilithrix luteola TaxID=1391654 RepID=A0A0K1PP32_9BACT|nr:hypothetical protein AKJ09_01942 [Labilithrix luteola]
MTGFTRQNLCEPHARHGEGQFMAKSVRRSAHSGSAIRVLRAPRDLDEQPR